MVFFLLLFFLERKEDRGIGMNEWIDENDAEERKYVRGLTPAAFNERLPMHPSNEITIDMQR